MSCVPVSALCCPCAPCILRIYSCSAWSVNSLVAHRLSRKLGGASCMRRPCAIHSRRRNNALTMLSAALKAQRNASQPVLTAFAAACTVDSQLLQARLKTTISESLCTSLTLSERHDLPQCRLPARRRLPCRAMRRTSVSYSPSMMPSKHTTRRRATPLPCMRPTLAHLVPEGSPLAPQGGLKLANAALAKYKGDQLLRVLKAVLLQRSDRMQDSLMVRRRAERYSASICCGRTLLPCRQSV